VSDNKQSPHDQSVNIRVFTAETGFRKEGGAWALGEPQGVGMDPRAVAACLGPSADAAGARPLGGGGGPNGEGWKVGAQLSREEGSYVSAVVERNRDVFAFSLEEIGEFKLFEVELKLKSEQPIFESVTCIYVVA
jgi:hypothetical protein